MKETAIAPANIAFIKYWGKKNDELRIPANSSFSMSLDKCLTTTTVEFDKKYKNDSFEIIGQKINEKEISRVSFYLERFRKLAKTNLFAKVVSKNSFPKSSGIASSASGFAALSKAAAGALELNLSEKELSILARLGSGSACRSVPAGFVEWKEGSSSETSYAYSAYPSEFWDLRDVLVIVKSDGKKVPSTEGHEASRKTSFFYDTSIKVRKQLFKDLKSAFAQKDFKKVGEIIEKDCINLHSVMMSTTPPLFYWSPKTLEIIKNVIDWRSQGIEAYFTIDAGPNVHLISEAKTEKALMDKLKEINGIQQIIINKPTIGAHLVNKDLF